MAALWRNMLTLGLKNIATHRCALTGSVTVIRHAGGYPRWQKLYLQDLHRRRIEAGPERERHRSEWPNWNYNAEIFAFGKRLGEDFNGSTLKKAFTHSSYIEQEEKSRAELGVELDAGLGWEDNTDLILKGEKLSREYIKAYLRFSLPSLPEEGICGICNHLMSEDVLTHVGRHLGITDLVLCSEFPPEVSTLSSTFLAVIGALAQDQSAERAQLFVQDFLLTQLIAKDLLDMWDITNPMGVLAGILAKQGRGPPEPRLLWGTGSETMVAAYLVGVYSDKELVGKSPGETVTIAEELAARDALRRIFKITEKRAQFKFGSKGHNLTIETYKPNPSLADISAKHVH